MSELYKKHRPDSLDRLVGQEEIVRMIQEFCDNKNIPHAILLTGPSGCGKTTVARIIRSELGCAEIDFREMNCADFRGIDDVRAIRKHSSLRAIGGETRVWLIDEAHKLSNDAQNALLKLLEDPPSVSYFILATTDPNKLIPTIKTRCTTFHLKPLQPTQMATLLSRVAKREKVKLSGDVVDRIIESAEGSPRKALVILDQIITLSEEDQLEAISRTDSRKQGIDLARTLLNPRTKWPEVAKLLKGIEEEPETIRHIVLGYSTGVMLSAGKLTARAYLIIEEFRDHFFDSKRAGLVASCYAVVNAR